MTSEKGYTIVIPDGAVYLQQFLDIKATGGKIKVSGTAGIPDMTIQPNSNEVIYDMTGRIVKKLINGNLYIKDGLKFRYQQR